MTTEFRALCARMADELDYYRISKEGDDEGHPLAREARAALAQPPQPAALSNNSQTDYFSTLMELTKDQLKAAARRLCEVRGIDPDDFSCVLIDPCQFSRSWEDNETTALKEIEAFLELQDAIAFGIAFKST